MAPSHVRRMIIIAWIAVIVAFCGWTAFMLLSERHCQPHYPLQFSETGNCSAEFKLTAIQFDGQETVVTAPAFVRIALEQKPKYLFLGIDDTVHSREWFRFADQYAYPRFEGRSVLLFSPQCGSLQWFPFDDLHVALSVSFKPATCELTRLDFYQHIDGFCVSEPPKYAQKNGGVTLEFRLARRAYFKLLFVMFGACVVLYEYAVARYVTRPMPLLCVTLGLLIALIGVRVVIIQIVPLPRSTMTAGDYVLLLFFAICVIIAATKFLLAFRAKPTRTAIIQAKDGAAASQTNASPALPVMTILFLSANPSGPPLKLDEEVKRIQRSLKMAKDRERLNFKQEWAVTIETLMQAVLDESPAIIHFSGHGQQDGILLQNENRQPQLVAADALASLFDLFKDSVRCVILNSCYSEQQAQIIKQHIPYVIGMKSGISDSAAIAFASGFYKAIGAGKDIPFAFCLGVAAIRLEGIPAADIPVLLE